MNNINRYPNDLTGMIINDIKVIEKEDKEKWVDPKNSHWKCKCLVCGETRTIRRNNLLSGHTSSKCRGIKNEE